jgi:hypothetical protein
MRPIEAYCRTVPADCDLSFESIGSFTKGTKGYNCSNSSYCNVTLGLETPVDHLLFELLSANFHRLFGVTMQWHINDRERELCFPRSQLVDLETNGDNVKS